MTTQNQSMTLAHTSQLAQDRTYRWIRNSLVIVALYSIVDFFIRYTIGNMQNTIGAHVGIWKEALLVLLYGLWYLKKRTYGQASAHTSRLHWMILIAFLGALLSILVTFALGGADSLDVNTNSFIRVHESFGVAFDGLKTLLEPTLYFFVLVALIDDEDTLREMANLMLVAGTLLGIYGIYQHFFVQTPASWVYSDAEQGATRVFATIGNPNALGGYMVLMTPIALSFALFSKDLRDRVLYGASALILLLCMIFTLSRGAWIGFFCGILLYVVMTKNWKLLGALVVGVAVVAIFIPSLAHRLTLIFSSSYLAKAKQAGRIEFWKRALLIWTHRPITGAGLGLVGDTVAVLHKVPGNTWIDNQYVKLLAETGIVGIVTYVGMLLTPVIKGWKWISETSNHSTFRYALNAGILAAVFGMIVENVTAAIFENVIDATYFWVLIAMLYTSIRISNNEKAQKA